MLKLIPVTFILTLALSPFAAIPADAATFSVPNIQMPDKDGIWGCKFTTTC